MSNPDENQDLILLPDEVDLRAFPYFELHVDQLLKSDLAARSYKRPRLLQAGLMLWCAAWHEIPAGSLPNDDRWLAKAACCPPDEWGRVKRDILQGWVLYDDGTRPPRWVHAVVVARSRAAWTKRLTCLYHMARGKEKKAAQRGGNKGWSVRDFPSIEQWVKARYPKSFALGLCPNVPRDDGTYTQAPDLLSRGTSPGTSPGTIPRERERERERDSIGEKGQAEGQQPTPQTPAPPPPEDWFERFLEAYRPPPTFSRLTSSIAFKKLVIKGTDPATIVMTAKLYAAQRGDMVQNPERFLTETWLNFKPEAERQAKIEATIQADYQEARKAWQPYTDKIAEAIGEPNFRAWFRTARPRPNGDASHFPIVCSTLVRDVLQTRFLTTLQAILPGEPEFVVTGPTSKPLNPGSEDPNG